MSIAAAPTAPISQPAETSRAILVESVPSRMTFGQRCGAIVELTKPGITRMVTITAAVGFVLGALGRGRSLTELALPAAGCLIGTVLSSSGANALNQWYERRRDAWMSRTSKRPLPEERLTPPGAFFAGFTLSVFGVLTLLVLCGPAPALVSLVTITWYLLFYTPLKPVTTLNTLIGAIPGALPPMIGWAATVPIFKHDAVGGMTVFREPGAWCLFLIMVVWQIPHFLAIAWMYRDDYAKGGHRMMPIVDPDGRATSTTILVWAVTLLVVTLSPSVVMHDRVSPVYAAVALLSGVWFIRRCITLYRDRTRDNARAVFLGSIMHLPLVLVAMVVDAVVVRMLG